MYTDIDEVFANVAIVDGDYAGREKGVLVNLQQHVGYHEHLRNDTDYRVELFPFEGEVVVIPGKHLLVDRDLRNSLAHTPEICFVVKDKDYGRFDKDDFIGVRRLSLCESARALRHDDLPVGTEVEVRCTVVAVTNDTSPDYDGTRPSDAPDPAGLRTDRASLATFVPPDAFEALCSADDEVLIKLHSTDKEVQVRGHCLRLLSQGEDEGVRKGKLRWRKGRVQMRHCRSTLTAMEPLSIGAGAHAAVGTKCVLIRTHEESIERDLEYEVHLDGVDNPITVFGRQVRQDVSLNEVRHAIGRTLFGRSRGPANPLL
jgi:hypothetical protein